MRILNIIQCTNLGGMEQTNLLRLSALKKRGHAINLVSLNPLGDLSPKLEDAGIPSIGLPYLGRYGWRSFPVMRRTFRDYEADAVLMTGHNLAATLAIANIHCQRKVLSIHYHHFEKGGDASSAIRWGIFYRIAARVFDHIVFISNYIREEALGVLPHLSAISSVVPGTYSLAPAPSVESRRNARYRLGLPVDGLVVGNAGWLIARKRFDVFMRVAAGVVAPHRNALFVIAGDGPKRSELAELAERLGIGKNILFLGWQNDLTDFYTALDVLLFNSDFDALPRTPMEAAGHGVPIVASSERGGLREVFRNDEEGLVLSRHDIERMSTAISQLLADPKARHSAGTRARLRVAEYGNVERDVGVLENLLSSGA